MQSIELKNINLDSFLKILVYNLAKINKNFDNKIQSLRDDMMVVKSDVKQINIDLNTNFNNMNLNFEREIDALNDRISLVNISLHPGNDMK